jgi:cysteinyl-tRNA synthetase
LARLDAEGMLAGARLDADNQSKAGSRDFVLESDQADANPRGITAAGPAVRAGTSSARRWRCACSATPPIDIHGGGIDLIFPHHENEIAQAEGATGQPFVRFWVHVEFLNLDNEKMSKSLGNVFTVRDILDKGYRASSLRYC